jgi:hypothetical protein
MSKEKYVEVLTESVSRYHYSLNLCWKQIYITDSILSCFSDYKRGSDWQWDLLNSLKHIPTCNFNSLTDLYTSQITEAHAKSSQFGVFTSRSPITHPNHVLFTSHHYQLATVSQLLMATTNDSDWLSTDPPLLVLIIQPRVRPNTVSNSSLFFCLYPLSWKLVVMCCLLSITT